jgi:hypothetical protein
MTNKYKAVSNSLKTTFQNNWTKLEERQKKSLVAKNEKNVFATSIRLNRLFVEIGDHCQ